MIELSNFKARLFQLNLSVHNFLAELSSCQSVDQAQLNLATHLKEEVVELYALWEESHQSTASHLLETEDALKKLSEFEQELVDLRTLLRKDALYLSENYQKKRVLNIWQN